MCFFSLIAYSRKIEYLLLGDKEKRGNGGGRIFGSSKNFNMIIKSARLLFFHGSHTVRSPNTVISFRICGFALIGSIDSGTCACDQPYLPVVAGMLLFDTGYVIMPHLALSRKR
jgi:hypothetical protein